MTVANKETKWQQLKLKDYSSKETITEWLTYAEEIIIANQRLAQQLDQEAETNKTKLSQLHQDLQNAIDQNNDELVGQIHRQIYQLSSGNDQQVTAYQYENNFLQKELTNLSNLHLVKSQSKLKKTVAIVAKLLEYFEDDQLPSPTNGLTSNRNSLFIQSRKKELLIANDKVKELASQTLIKDITNMNDQEKIKGLHGNLAWIIEKWEKHLDGSQVRADYQGKETSLQKLLPLLQELLTITDSTDLQAKTKTLVDTWITDYPEQIKSKELVIIQHYQVNWDNLVSLEVIIEKHKEEQKKLMDKENKDNNNSSEEAEELKLEIADLKRKLAETQKKIEAKSKEWSQANARIDSEVKKATQSATKKFASFVNPNNATALEQAAKEKLNMITQSELAEELLPLQQKQEELIAELTPWQDTFADRTAEQVQEEIETITAEKKQARLDRKAMELEKDNYKEDVERMEGEVDNYYQEYQRFLDLSSKQRSRIDQLEEQIHELGHIPVEEPDSEEEVEDNDKENQSNTDSEASRNSGEENPEASPLSLNDDRDFEDSLSLVNGVDNQSDSETTSEQDLTAVSSEIEQQSAIVAESNDNEQLAAVAQIEVPTE